MPNDTPTTPAPRPRRPLRAFLLASSLVVLGAGAMTTGAAVAVGRARGNAIVPGVSVGGIDLGGLTPEAATERLRAWARQQMALPLVVTAPVSQRRWAFPLADIAGRFDVDAAVREAVAVGDEENLFERLFRGDKPRDVALDAPFVYDPERLVRRLREIGETIRTKPRNAVARADKNGKLVLVSREKAGVSLDVDATRAALEADGLHDGATATLVVKEEAPKITAADLGKMGNLLAAYSTSYSSSSSNRKHNVWLAASHIDGTLLAPGEQFSYNASVGPRTAPLGWRMAHQYQDGQVVDGIGGGVCQVSSTLYNAVLLAGLKIVERHNHSMPVAYLTPGRDATVSYGFLDFKFANSTDGPIYLSATADGNRLFFRIYGSAPVGAKEIRIVTSGRDYAASGGFRVSAWREIVGADGAVVREALGSDYYRPPAPKKAAPRPAPRRPAPPKPAPAVPTGGTPAAATRS